MSDSGEISAERLKTMLRAEQTLGTDIVGEIPHTGVTDLSSGRREDM